MQEGLKSAVNIANSALKNVDGYKKFVLQKKGHLKKIVTGSEFFNLPVADKRNYINSFKLLDICRKNVLPSTTYASSGSSGSPTFWFRDQRQETTGGKMHEQIFNNIFGIKKQDPTLVIVCFSMGVWVAGNFTLSCCRWVASQGYKLTTITPGIEKHDIFYILQRLAPQFKNVILAGYPSFVMDALTEARAKKIDLPKNLKVITAGDSFSEIWRDSVRKLIGPQAKPESIISIYGSADAGATGFETPLSIFLKRFAVTNKYFYGELFGKMTKEPAFIQYNPNNTFYESVNDELILTANTAIPLIRYNTHDIGKIIEYEAVLKLLAKYKISEKAKLFGLNYWKLPFIVKNGRTDVAVTFYALNIYPENIHAGLNDSKISKMVTGNFRAYTKLTSRHRKEHLFLEIEMAENKSISREILKKITETITENLIKINGEFRKLHSTIGKSATPIIHLLSNLKRSPSNHSKVLESYKNNKPRIII